MIFEGRNFEKPSKTPEKTLKTLAKSTEEKPPFNGGFLGKLTARFFHLKMAEAEQ